MGTSILGIAVSGLNAAQVGLSTAGHNVTNASTDGYRRQTIHQATNIPQRTGAGFMGQGVHIQTVTRAYDAFLERQVLSTQTQAEFYNEYLSQITQIDNILADPTAGLSPALQDFFTGVQEMAAYPASVPARQSMLSSGEALVARFHTLETRLQEASQGVEGKIETLVNSINSYAGEIAKLNQAIVLAKGGSEHTPNDLLDQRDQLLTELNQLIRVQTVPGPNDTVNVFIGTGQSLVVSTLSGQLSTIASDEDASKLDVAYSLSGVNNVINERDLAGGQLGALLEFRRETLVPARNAIGRVAMTLAQTFNDQHRLGQDLNGALGGDFFAAGAPQVLNNANNTGNAAISATVANIGQLTTSDYRMVRTAAGYQVTRLSDNTVNVYAALPQTLDGVTLSVASGAANLGDSFLIQPTRDGAADFSQVISNTSLIAAAAPMRSAAGLSNTGEASIAAGSVNTPPPPNANLTQTVTITFTSATTFNVTGVGTGNPVGVAYTAGANITYNGWTTQISGTPAAGDTFTMSANLSGVADNRNALLLAGLQTTNTMAGGTASYQSAYSQLVSDVGNQTREIQISSTAQDALLNQAKTKQQSFAGVNLDEEAANLMRYQQAYLAASRVVQVAQRTFDEILTMFN